LDLVGLWTLQYAPGMRGVVMFGGLPARVGDSLIEQLRKRLAASDIVDNYGTILEPGDCVVITDGPLIDVQAVFDQCLSPAGRVRVLIQLLKQWTKVELDADVLRKIDKFPQRRLANRSVG
jgi:transcription antitermination factor NusG